MASREFFNSFAELSKGLCVAALGLFGSPLFGQNAEFIRLGDLAPGTSVSLAEGVSDYTPRAVGFSQSPNGQRAFLWSEDQGMLNLGALGTIGNGGTTKAFDLSANGSVVVGEANYNNGQANVFEAFRWTQATGMVGLGDLPGGTFESHARDVSADGSVIVGDSSAPGQRAFRWTEQTGMVNLGKLPGVVGSLAFGVSADGSAVVGYSGAKAFRWTQATGMLELTMPPTGILSYAYAANADGSVVTGYFTTGSTTTEAFRWTETTGAVGLGVMPGTGGNTRGFGISADGSVIVGLGGDSGGVVGQANDNGAFIWTEANGVQNLYDVLLQAGATGFTEADILEATAVSADGTMIVGQGFNALGKMEGWVAILDRPWSTYCTAKQNSLGCTPSIQADGYPHATNLDPFVVRAEQVLNQKVGLFIYRPNGSQVSVPFQGGILCLGPTGLRRSSVVVSGGSTSGSDCSGVYELDFNAFAAGLAGGNPDPSLSIPGITYQVQAWGRDPGFASPNNTTLSNALDITVGP